MTKLPVLSAREVIAALRKSGFKDAPKKGKGSHSALVKQQGGTTRLVIIPEKKSIPRGTLRAIIEQAGLSREEFLEVLRS